MFCIRRPHSHSYLKLSLVKWLSHVQLLATPWAAAHQASLSITNSRSLLKPMSIELVMPSSHLILCCPLLSPSICASIRVLSNELVLHIRWPKYWSFSWSISPANEYSGLISFRMDWLYLLAAIPWTAVCQASLSFTISQSVLKPLFIESMTPSNHLILCCPLLYLSSISSSIRVLVSSESALCIRWTNYWSFSFSISPSNEYLGLISFRIDSFDFLAVQPLHTPFPIWNQSIFPCLVLTVASWPAYTFHKGQVRWSGIPSSLRIFPQFVVIHTVKGFSIVSNSEVDAFLELSCFF